MLLDDIATYLAAQSTAFTILSASSGNLAKQVMLDSTPNPTTVTVLYETPGSVNDYTMSTSSGGATVYTERPSLQILSRSSAYQTARNRAQTAYTILDGLAGRTLPTATGTVYQEITADQAPFFLGPDDNNRFIVSTNYSIRKNVG